MTPMPRAFDADHPANRLAISGETVLCERRFGKRMNLAV
jgi:hypothetical protein